MPLCVHQRQHSSSKGNQRINISPLSYAPHFLAFRVYVVREEREREREREKETEPKMKRDDEKKCAKNGPFSTKKKKGFS